MAGTAVDLGAYEFQGTGQVDAPVLTVSGKTATSITVKWTSVADATGYVFEYKAEGDADYTSISLAASKSQRKISGLVGGESYSIRIKALGDGSMLDSDYAEVVVATSQPLPSPEVTLTDAGGDYLSFSWTPIENAVGYKVMYKSPTDPAYTTLTLGAETTLTLNGLEQEVGYSLKVCALGDGSDYTNSPYSPLTAYRTINPFQLIAPEFTAIDASKNFVMLHWNAVEHARKYYVAYAPVGSTSFTIKSVAATNSHYQLTGLSPNTEYQIKIRVLGEGEYFGEGEYLNSRYSPVTLVTTTRTAVAPTALAVPTLTASATSKSILMEWDANPRATGYTVLYKEKTDSSYTSINVKAGESSLNLTGLKPDSTYYVRVRAVGDGEIWTNSAYCGTVVVKTDPPVEEPIAAPSIVATSATSNSITVEWDEVVDATEYVLAYALAGASEFTTVSVASTSYTIEGLLDETDYVVKVLAKGDGMYALDSPYSETSSVTTEADPNKIVVTSFADVVDATDGVVTFREAVLNAVDGGTIVFDAALVGKTVTLDSGLGQIVVGKTLTIDAMRLYDAATNTPAITLSGGGATRILQLSANGSLVLKGLKLTGGRTSAGNGDAILSRGSLAIENCVFSENDYCVKVYSGAVTALNSAIGNSLYSFRATGGVVAATNCDVSGNVYSGFSVAGGEVEATNCTLNDNGSSGISIASGAVEATNCTITGNLNSGVNVKGGEVSTTDCLIGENNVGVVVEDGNFTATNSDISGNNDVGVMIEGGGVSLIDAMIRNNAGSGIYCGAAGTVIATNSLIVGNSAYRGGGVDIYGGSATLYSCTIAGNSATYGGGVHLYANSSFGAYNTIIAGNRATYGADVNKNKPTASAYAYYTLSSYTAWDSAVDNLTYDATKPLFTDAANWDYTLATNSQAIDKGKNSYVSGSTDLRGKTRIVNGTVDLGAYERQTNSAATLDFDAELFEEFDESLDLIAESLLD